MSEWEQDLLGMLAVIEDGDFKDEDWYVDEDGKIKIEAKNG